MLIKPTVRRLATRWTSRGEVSSRSSACVLPFWRATELTSPCPRYRPQPAPPRPLTTSRPSSSRQPAAGSARPRPPHRALAPQARSSRQRRQASSLPHLHPPLVAQALVRARALAPPQRRQRRRRRRAAQARRLVDGRAGRAMDVELEQVREALERSRREREGSALRLRRVVRLRARGPPDRELSWLSASVQRCVVTSPPSPRSTRSSTCAGRGGHHG